MPQRFPGFSCNSNGCRRDISVENGSTCDALGPPPAIATCIAGAARTFGTPVVQSHLRRNLVEALGGSDGSRLFLLLKTLDSNKFVKRSEPGAVVFKQHLGEASVGGLLATYATQTSNRRLADPRQLCYSHVFEPRLGQAPAPVARSQGGRGRGAQRQRQLLRGRPCGRRLRRASVLRRAGEPRRVAGVSDGRLCMPHRARTPD